MSKNKSLNFNRFSNSNYQRRTNNICESFHRTLNSIINHKHSNASYLVDKLSYFAIESYKKYTVSLINKNDNINYTDNIAKDIFNFIDEYH